MFPFGGLLKEVHNEGNSRELDGMLNRRKAIEQTERKHKHWDLKGVSSTTSAFTVYKASR